MHTQSDHAPMWLSKLEEAGRGCHQKGSTWGLKTTPVPGRARGTQTPEHPDTRTPSHPVIQTPEHPVTQSSRHPERAKPMPVPMPMPAGVHTYRRIQYNTLQYDTFNPRSLQIVSILKYPSILPSYQTPISRCPRVPCTISCPQR